VGLLVVLAVAALCAAGFRGGSTATTLTTAAAAAAPGTGTMTPSHRGEPVATASALPDRPHLVDRRPETSVDGFIIALALLLVLGLSRRDGAGRRSGGTDDHTEAGPPPATRAWHRRGPPLALLA
jgi:hypothetical protein